MVRNTSTYGDFITAYGKFINEMEWDYYCTFSTRYSLSCPAARRLMERLHGFLAEKYRLKTTLFWVAELFDSKYGYHVHALLKAHGQSDLQAVNQIKKAWQIVSKGKYGKEFNNTIIKPYERDLGGNFYVAKYLWRSNTDYDLILAFSLNDEAERETTTTVATEGSGGRRSFPFSL